MDGHYTARTVRCYGCVAIAQASVKFKDDDARSAVRYVVTKRQRRG